MSLGPRPSPAYGGHAARLGLPRWGPAARRSQLRGHETQTVTRSGLRFRGRTAIPARKRECRAEATPGGKGTHGLLPYCAPALRPWRPGRGPRHTRAVTEPEDVTPGGRPGGPQCPGGGRPLRLRPGPHGWERREPGGHRGRAAPQGAPAGRWSSGVSCRFLDAGLGQRHLLRAVGERGHACSRQTRPPPSPRRGRGPWGWRRCLCGLVRTARRRWSALDGAALIRPLTTYCKRRPPEPPAQAPAGRLT